MALTMCGILLLTLPVVLYVFAFYLISGEESFFKFLWLFALAHIAVLLFCFLFFFVVYLISCLICFCIGIY